MATNNPYNTTLPDNQLKKKSNTGLDGTNPPVTQTPIEVTNTASYNSLNDQVWGEGGDGYKAHMEQAKQEAAKRQNDPTYGQAYTNEQMQQAVNNADLSGGIFSYSQHETPDTYTGRTAYTNTAAADESLLSDGEYAYIQYAKQMYDAAQTAEDKAYWHNEAEKVRARHNYSGGSDGSMYITNGEMGLTKQSNGQGGRLPGAAGTQSGTSSDLKGLLEAWQDAAINQQNGQIDYAVAKAVADLERALADAQPQFKEQAETVAREERQALDNSALYAEMRGDKGGIGQEQYNSIQNTAAQNHLTVQQAQTKLATDTQRQIADLRAQGEFEKADAALQITQQYLQQLIGLEQWAAEYNLSVDQFNESVRQWEAEYNMAMQQLQIGQNQWQAEFDAAQNRWQAEFDYGKQSDMANIGWALLESGVSLSKEQLAAMGIDEAQASQILMQQQLKAALKGGENDNDNNVTIPSLGTDSWYSYVVEQAKKAGQSVSDYLYENRGTLGLTTGVIDDYVERIENWQKANTPATTPINDPKDVEEQEAFQYINEKSVIDLGLGAVSYAELKQMEAKGIIWIFDMGDEIGVTWAPGWTTEKYKKMYR